MNMTREAAYADLFVLGMAVESTLNDMRGTVVEIRYHEDRRYIKVEWPTAAIWYNAASVERELLAA